MRGMILAAGEGRRMLPLTHEAAKPSLKVFGVPLVVRAARLLRRAGIREIVVNLHHHGRTIRRTLLEQAADPRTGGRADLSDVTFSYSHEDTLLGTGGGIGRVAGWLAEEGTAVVVNSDFMSDIDLTPVIDRHRETKALGTLVVVDPSRRFPGELWTDARDRILSFGEPKEKTAAGPLEFTGVAVLEPELLARFPDERCDSVRDVYPWAMGKNGLFAHRHTGWWWEFGSLERFLDGQVLLARQRQDTLEGAGGAIVRDDDEAFVWLGPGADVSPSASLSGVVLVGAGARVRARTELRDTVLLDRAQVPAVCRLDRCIVGRDTILTGGMRLENLAIASSPCGGPAGGAASPETPGGRPLPPEGCRELGDLWVREIPVFPGAGRPRAGRPEAGAS